MANVEFDKKGMADLEKQLGQKFKRVEAEANKATAGKSTPEGKARAFEKVLHKHGVKNVDRAGLKRKFRG